MAIFFKNTNDVKLHYNEITKNTDFDTLINPLRQVQEIYIEPFLGSQLTAELAADATATAEPTNIKKEVINSLKDAIAHYLIFVELPSKTFIIGNAGARQATGDQTAPLSIASIKIMQSQLIRKADHFLNRALKLITQNLSDFSNFQPEFKIGCKLFPTSILLENLIGIKGFKTFALMSPYLQRVENEDIVTILGNDFLNQILIPDNWKETTVSEYASYYVGYKALTLALPNLYFIIDGNGLMILSSTDGEDTRKHVTDQNKLNLKAFNENAEKTANEYKNKLLTFLFKYADDFPTWKTSDFYTANSTQAITKSSIITAETAAVGFFRK
jgi:hypothetical protein